MDESYKLSEAKHEQIYRKLKIRMFEGTMPSTTPTLVIIAAQPGAGKSKLAETGKEKFFKTGNIVVINSDNYRESHPQSDEIFQADDKKYGERTNPDVLAWTGRLLDDAAEGNRNIIFETTLRNKESTLEMIENYKEKGYKVHVMALAVSREDSMRGIVSRYVQQKEENGGYGRWVPPEFHDEAYKNLPETLRAVEKQGLIESMAVYTRDGKELYSNARVDGIYTKPPHARDAAAAVEKERARLRTKEERQAITDGQKKIEQKMKNCGADAKEIAQTKSIMRGTFKACGEMSR